MPQTMNAFEFTCGQAYAMCTVHIEFNSPLFASAPAR